ncbi:hypothetical protein RSJ68_05930 [Neisseria sp. DTU_2020_1000833_1_SI_GRL_NUU_006]|nr:hypothetical protein RSJ68_05930 [Neisseria sp. DTU_2020_1000833_1_SI_GRL_NUU_006]
MNTFLVVITQLPSGGCVLKPLQGLSVIRLPSQLPSGGCVLKR